ncbi:hypothetical protein Tco_0189515 [Tanacetum coccineum]
MTLCRGIAPNHGFSELHSNPEYTISIYALNSLIRFIELAAGGQEPNPNFRPRKSGFEHKGGDVTLGGGAFLSILSSHLNSYISMTNSKVCVPQGRWANFQPKLILVIDLRWSQIKLDLLVFFPFRILMQIGLNTFSKEITSIKTEETFHQVRIDRISGQSNLERIKVPAPQINSLAVIPNTRYPNAKCCSCCGSWWYSIPKALNSISNSEEWMKGTRKKLIGPNREFYEIFRDVSVRGVAFTDCALMLMPKFASTLITLIWNTKEKLANWQELRLNRVLVQRGVFPQQCDQENLETLGAARFSDDSYVKFTGAAITYIDNALADARAASLFSGLIIRCWNNLSSS